MAYQPDARSGNLYGPLEADRGLGLAARILRARSKELILTVSPGAHPAPSM